MTGPEDPGAADPTATAGMELLDNFAPMAEALGGMRSQLEAQGFAPDVAGALVLEAIRTGNLESEKKLLEARGRRPRWPWEA